CYENASNNRPRLHKRKQNVMFGRPPRPGRAEGLLWRRRPQPTADPADVAAAYRHPRQSQIQNFRYVDRKKLPARCRVSRPQRGITLHPRVAASSDDEIAPIAAKGVDAVPRRSEKVQHI